eukprot:gene12727-15973_t
MIQSGPTGRSRLPCSIIGYKQCMRHRYFLRHATPSLDLVNERMQQIEASQEEQTRRLHRFYVPKPLGEGTSRILVEGEEVRHMTKALRLKEGDAAETCDGLGNTVECMIASIDARRQYAWLEPSSSPVHTPWSGPKWIVAVACTTLKGGRTEWLVEKCTELGAHSLIPLITERSQPLDLHCSSYTVIVPHCRQSARRTGVNKHGGGEGRPGTVSPAANTSLPRQMRPGAHTSLALAVLKTAGHAPPWTC